MRWYALLCLQDQFDAQGRLEYRAGEVKSYGTELSPPEVRAAKGIEAVPIGDYGESGPDFSRERFDPMQRTMVPYTPPVDAVDALLDKTTWSTADLQAAVRELLKGQRGT